MLSSKSKKILFITIGNKDHASSRIRVLQYFPYVENINYRIKWIPRIPNHKKDFIFNNVLFAIQKRYYSLIRSINLTRKKWDVIFIQKIFIHDWILKKIRKNNIPIIFDFDDAIYLNEKSDQKNLQKTESLINAATTIIVSSEILSKFCQQLGKDPILINSPVDTDKLFPIPNKISSKVCIGWIGSPWTTKYLYQLADVFKKLSLKFNFEIVTVGAKKDFNIEGINIINLEWTSEKENEYLNLMDIGIMPLTIDKYAEGKGGYKLLQYMSVGIPSVASPVGINNQIIDHGKNGYLASNSEDWVYYLELLISNKNQRTEMGLVAREKVLKEYSLNVNSEKFLNTIELLNK